MPHGRSIADGARAIEVVRVRVDAELERFLRERRAELAELDPPAGELVDEILRLIRAGGRRLRPAFLCWAHLAAGGEDGGPVIRAASALELVHTFALVHDDVMDGAKERRGVRTTQLEFAERADRDPTTFGLASAVLVGDLAHVLAESLLRSSGFGADVLGRALERFDRMRLAMAAGQYLDLRSRGRTSEDRGERLARLKGGSYTVEGPVAIGASLAGASSEIERALAAFARPAGEAFQLRDDLIDGDAAPGVSPATVDLLLDEAVRALDDPVLEPGAASALGGIAELLRAGHPSTSGTERTS